MKTFGLENFGNKRLIGFSGSAEPRAHPQTLYNHHDSNEFKLNVNSWQTTDTRDSN